MPAGNRSNNTMSNNPRFPPINFKQKLTAKQHCGQSEVSINTHQSSMAVVDGEVSAVFVIVCDWQIDDETHYPGPKKVPEVDTY